MAAAGSRLIQSACGAAVPGLGMAMAIRAFGPESRGIVLGVIGATTGFGGGIGPLLAVLFLSARLPLAVAQELELEAAATPTFLWRPECSMPWIPECEESELEAAEGA